MSQLVDRGHDVLFVETDSFVGRHVVDLVRGADRRSLLRRLVATERVAPRLRVMKAPSLLPWGHRFSAAARVNAAFTSVLVRRRLRHAARPRVLWLYDPCFAACIGASGERLAVYDCVDDYAEQAGPAGRKLVARLDRLAAARAQLVFATARSLVERHLEHNAQTHLVRNVGDFAHFAPAADRALAAPDVATLRRPIIGFAGNLLAQKVDFELIEQLATRRPDWTIAIVGPAHADTTAEIERLAGAEANVRWFGPVRYASLPAYVAAFDVAIIPYRTNAYTRSCFPLKTFEYLAAGKPVVASGLPELADMEPHVVLVDDAPAFVEAIDRALDRIGPAEVDARQSIAAANTWATRTNRMLELVLGELDQCASS
jgi:glycosyltransferase involved in cell wall biosynthesis